MPLSPLVAKIAGAHKCQRWGKGLEGELLSEENGVILPSLEKILAGVGDFVKQEREYLKKHAANMHKRR